MVLYTLYVLQNQTNGKPITHTDVGNLLGISRTTVWRAVRRLKDDNRLAITEHGRNGATYTDFDVSIVPLWIQGYCNALVQILIEGDSPLLDAVEKQVVIRLRDSLSFGNELGFAT
jgi:DNA-binding Lrp family transcriptional regulator